MDLRCIYHSPKKHKNDKSFDEKKENLVKTTLSQTSILHQSQIVLKDKTTTSTL